MKSKDFEGGFCIRTWTDSKLFFLLRVMDIKSNENKELMFFENPSFNAKK